jgi:hypothetical protein
MENLPLHINPKGGPKLIDNLLIPFLMKGHKRKEVPLLKLGNESINLRMIMILERIKQHMLVRKDRRLGTMLTLLENHGEVVVVVEAQPKPLLDRRIPHKIIWILSPLILQISHSLPVINM